MNLPARGLAFSKEIEEAIRGVDRLVLVVTPGVPASKYVQAEVECALRLCKPITPEDCSDRLTEVQIDALNERRLDERAESRLPQTRKALLAFAPEHPRMRRGNSRLKG